MLLTYSFNLLVWPRARQISFIKLRFMYQQRLFFFILVILFSLPVCAQDGLKVDLGMNVGMSRLYHNTRFETTTLYNLYKTVELTHDDDYTWDDFADDFEIRDKYTQPRFGFSTLVTYGELPLFLMGELMSSPSSYQKMMIGVSGGVGKTFFTYDSVYYATFLGGYKFVQDFGFGSSTLVNSIGNRDARELIATYFDPKEPLGRPRGHLFILRGGIGKVFGDTQRITVGVDAYGELDLTPQLSRESRMTSIGVLAYVRFRLIDL